MSKGIKPASNANFNNALKRTNDRNARKGTLPSGKKVRTGRRGGR